jgi:hypothetical protein
LRVRALPARPGRVGRSGRRARARWNEFRDDLASVRHKHTFTRTHPSKCSLKRFLSSRTPTVFILLNVASRSYIVKRQEFRGPEAAPPISHRENPPKSYCRAYQKGYTCALRGDTGVSTAPEDNHEAT